MKYEYKVLTLQAEGLFGGMVNNQDFEEQLNQLGVEGWNLLIAWHLLLPMGKLPILFQYSSERFNR